MNLQRNVSLRDWSSFRTPAVAELATVVHTLAELREVLHECAARSIPTTIIGGGTNIVLLDDIAGCVVRNAICGVVSSREDDHSVVTAGAGESWHGLVRRCVAQSLAGIENLALIPGTVGAAPIQNIGAYGVELSSTLRHVTVVERATGDVRVLAAADCGLEYRDSIFKKNAKDTFVIVDVALSLTHRFEPVLGYPDVAAELERMGVRPTIASVAEAVVRVRRRKLPDPRTIGNAGSFFKNPVLGSDAVDRVRALLPGIPDRRVPAGYRIPAAALIEACGLKGRRWGPVGTWHRQPLVLVNHGGARGSELLAAATEIRERVNARFDVWLELEPIVIGSSLERGSIST